jgi:hypothetical protein
MQMHQLTGVIAVFVAAGLAAQEPATQGDRNCKPVETRESNVPAQKPAFAGQTRGGSRERPRPSVGR